MSDNFGIKRVTIAKTKDESSSWSTKKVEEYKYNKMHNIKNIGPSPFFEDNINHRKADIAFNYTDEELEEISRCMESVEYFADKYCYAMTDNGVQKIELYPYQRETLKCFQNNRYVVYLASRQVGKTITSSFYILWYICFHTDRNVLVVANKGDTMKEIMKKVQAVYDNLPYFLKPGLLTKNVKSLDFDNGCRIVGQETSETPGLGFTIHLLYADEFAHIPSNKKEPFFRSVMPTLSSSKISQAIFTSTPNKQDLFYRLYSKAVPWKESNDEIKKKRPFVSITTYWDAPPGRDEEWKAQQIELLGGSIENWNQEFECSFLASDELFLDSFLINYLEKIKVKFVHKKISVFEDRNMDYSKLTFHPKFDIDEILPTDRFVISIDTSDGVGRDYFVANIFKIEPFSLAKIRKSEATTDELDFFRLRQVGLYHDNKTSIDEVMKILNVLFFDFFDIQQIRIVLEMNFKGDLIIEKLKRHKEYSPEVLMHTKHSESADTMMPGLKLQKKNKKFLVSELKGAMKTRKIILNDTTTIEEGKNFGVDKNGNFKSQTGKDDIIMSCVNVTSFLHSAEMIECVEDIFDLMDRDKKLAIEKIINNSDNTVTSDMEYYKMLQEYL